MVNLFIVVIEQISLINENAITIIGFIQKLIHYFNFVVEDYLKKHWIVQQNYVYITDMLGLYLAKIKYNLCENDEINYKAGL